MKKRSVRNSWLIWLVALVGVVFFGMQLSKLEFDNNIRVFLPPDHPVNLQYDQLMEDFGRAEGISIALTFKNGLIIDAENLKLIQDLTADLETLAYIDDVRSLTNTDYLQGISGGLETKELVAELPTDQEEEESVKARLESWEVYERSLYSDDYKSTQIVVTLLASNSINEDEKVYYAVKDVLKNYQDKEVELKIAGIPSVAILMGRGMRQDMKRLLPFVLLVLFLTLYLSFQRLGGMVLPLVPVLVSVIVALGLMGLFGIKLTMVVTIIPVLLIAVGSAYGIHIIGHYYDELPEKGMAVQARARVPAPASACAPEENNRLIAKTLKRVGMAVVLAGLTTIAGFGSLIVSEITSMRNFGIFTSVGVLVALLASLILIPAILRIKGGGFPRKKADVNRGGLGRILQGLAAITLGHKRAVMVVTVIIIAASIFGVTQVVMGNWMVMMFKEDTEIREADAFLNKNFGGTSFMNITIEGESSGSITHPDALQAMDELSYHIKENYHQIGKVLSAVELIKRMNHIMNMPEEATEAELEEYKNSLSYYEIPTEPQKYNLKSKEDLQRLISQYLLLFSGNVDSLLDDPLEPTYANMVIQIKTGEHAVLNRIKQTITEYAEENFPPEYQVRVNGAANVQLTVNELVIASQIKSILLSLAIVFVILALYYKSLTAGCLGVVALSIPLLFNFGLMGLLKIRLDIGTAMMASIAIGTGIDYTIHFLNAYRFERRRTPDWAKATERTLFTAGKAIIFNAISVAAGFAVLLFSNFLPLVSLGLLISVTMITSSVVSLTVLPTLVNALKPHFLQSKATLIDRSLIKSEG